MNAEIAPSNVSESQALALLPAPQEIEKEQFSPKEEQLLAEAEAEIESGLESYVRMGLALARIRNLRLYRREYATFEEYCRNKWDYGRRYVNQIIQAAQLEERLGAIAPIAPKNEAQVRPLICLSQEQAINAWEKAIELSQGGRITSKLVRKAVAELTGHSDPAAKDEASSYSATLGLSAPDHNGLKWNISKLIENATMFVRTGQDRHNVLRLLEQIKHYVSQLPD